MLPLTFALRAGSQIISIVLSLVITALVYYILTRNRLGRRCPQCGI
jgi:branched-subunit amino acid ABC-type transport system permease component